MKIKKYVVREMQEAMQLIREDLGPEAVIISSYPVPTRSFLDLFQPRRLEVTAAVDDGGGPFLEKPPLKAGREPVFSLPGTVSKEEKNAGKFGSILRQRVFKMGHLEAWRDRLKGVEVEEKVIELIFSGLPAEVPEDGAHDPDGYAGLLVKGKIISLVEPAYGGDRGAGLQFFVGPPGTGKTFTVAKLAAKKAVFEKKKVALISVSPGRPWAAGDLQRLLPGAEVAFETASTPAELVAAVGRQKDREEILVDTEGVPPTKRARLLMLRNILEAVELPKEVVLVLSCLTRNRDLYAAITEFGRVGFSRMCFTRLDETGAYGPLLNAVCFTGKPVSYAACGLDVPDDIWPVDPAKLAEVLLKGARELNEQDFEIHLQP